MSDPNWKDHLKPPKKGEIRNPNGRPKGLCMTTILKRMLEKKLKITDPFTKKEGQKTISTIAIMKLLQKVIAGDIKAIEMIKDWTEGKALQVIQNVEPPTINIHVVDVETKQNLEKLKELG